MGNKKVSKPRVNPFMPSSIKQAMSSQRRPWAHIYPLRSDGMPRLPNWTSRNISNTQDKVADVLMIDGTAAAIAVANNSNGSSANDTFGGGLINNRISPDFLVNNTNYGYHHHAANLRPSITQNIPE